MRYKEFSQLIESSTAGATSSGNVASNVAAFGTMYPSAYEYGGKTFHPGKKEDKKRKSGKKISEENPQDGSPFVIKRVM